MDVNALSTDLTLAHLASWALPGGPSQPIDSYCSTETIAAASRHRISGVVADALEHGALGRAADPQHVEALRSDQLEQLRQTLLAEADLVRVGRLLSSAGVELRVLKGLATAHLDHADPAERITSDADILVRPDELERAHVALTSAVDTDRTVPDRRPSHVDRYGKDRTLRLVGGGWLDLHRMLAPAFWGFQLNHQDCFLDGETFTLAGTTLAALTIEQRFVHAILHAGYTHDIRIQSFRDIALLAPRLERDPLSVLDDSWTRPVRGLLARGIRRFEEVLDVNQEWTCWGAEVRPSRRERLALRTLNLSGSRVHWGGPLALPPQQWPGYLVPLAIPSASYLAYHGRNRREHLREAGRALRRKNP